MTSKVKTIRNNHVIVTFMNEELSVIVNENKPLGAQRCFGGYASLEERFDEMWHGFSEDISFNDAVNHFTLEPAIHDTKK